MKDLLHKTAVVTGAASGIGRAVATRFAHEGMNVVLADIEQAALDEVVDELNAAGHSVIGVCTDVSRWDDVQELAKRTMAQFEAVHVVHNNAGVVTAGPVEALSIADYEWVLGVDLWSVIYGVKAFLPLIEAAGEGHIINTASTAGLVAAPHIAPYNIAKFGVVALTETLARELAMRKSPVAASVLCPGAVNTQIPSSERNRPPQSAAQHVRTEAEDRFISGASELLAKRGLDPIAVADMVVHAIRSQQFWILTHPEWKGVLQNRIKALVDDDSLSSGFGG
jgi:NAD(P)-dependent dehydrogenase (short-subunit alcohol dehydrogenase family)